MRNRDEILKLLNDLPQSPVATPAEAPTCYERHQLAGPGVGYIDSHLLAATALAENAWLWTGDKRLHKVASKMELTFGLSESQQATVWHSVLDT